MGEQGGVSRRDVLKLSGATGGLISMAGCLGWLRGSDESDGDGSDGDDESSDDEESDQGGDEQPANEDENTDGETNTTEEADPSGDTNESETNSSDENDTGGDGNESDPENETDEEEEDRVPDKNETEPDKEQYEQQEEREIVELPEDTVDVELQADQIEESETSPGGLHIYGSVTNTSEQYVDTVDLDISIYDEAGEYVGADIVSVSDLDPEESADVDRQISAYDLQGQPASVEVDVMVYGPE